MVTQALWLVSISVAFGALSGTVSVVTGLQGHSLSVFAAGLGVLADVTGSAVLIWRFRAERHQPGQSGAQETRAAIMVSVALAVVSALLTVGSVTALVNGSRPGTSGITLVAAAVSLAALTPLVRQAPSGQANGQPRAARRWDPQRDRSGHPASWRSSPSRCTTHWDGGGPTGSPHWPSRPSRPPKPGTPRHAASAVVEALVGGF
jgi:hypothetical protein